MKGRNKRTRDSSSDSSSDSTTSETSSSSESSSESQEESSEQEDAPKQSSSSKNYEDAILARNGGKVKVRSVKYKYRREGDAPSRPNTNRGVIEAADKNSRISIKKGVKADVKITNPNGKRSTTNYDDETDGNTIPKEKRKSKKKKKSSKSSSVPPPQYDPTTHGFQTDDESVRPEVIEIANDFQAGKPTTNDIEKYVEELLAYSHKNKLAKLKDHCQMIMKSQLDSNTTDEMKLKYRTLAVKYKADDLRDFIKVMFGLT